MSTLADRLRRVQDRMAAAARRAGREPSDVTLVAVTKTHPPETILEAIALGVTDLGENRVDEAAVKIPAVAAALPSRRSDLVWHMVGHVQSRKAEPAAGFDWIHSVDSAKLAERLSRFAGQRNKTQAVLLEFNVSGEPSKYGLRAAEGRLIGAPLLSEVEAILAQPHLRVAGLMTMAPLVQNPDQARPVFRALRALRDDLARRFPPSGGPLPHVAWQHLSMGMTDDFEVAIEEGATMVRIGRAIFGERRPAA